MLADVRELSEDAAKLAAAPLWPLPDDELVDLLRTAHRLEQAAGVLKARLVRQAATRGVPAAQGHRSTAGWLRALLVLDPQPARELAEQADALARPAIEQAVLEGRTDLRQAAVIAATAKAIPADLREAAVIAATARSVPAGLDRLAGLDPPDRPDQPDRLAVTDVGGIVEQAERTMIEMAGRLPAYQLRRIGDRILAYVAPHLADQADEAALARQEARAHRRRGLTLSLPVDGLVRLSGLLGAEDAATVHAALHPLGQPTTDDNRTPAQRRADALIEVCRLALRTTALPDDGGEPPQLAVTIAYHPLTQALGTATTDTGHRLSAATARRLACDARILPAILGSTGQILDLGRTRRLATGPLRRALHIRDQGCAFPDCDRPPRWTDAHHITAWTNNGTTTLDNLVLLCRHHHRLIHHPTAGWTIRLGPDHHPDFIPPPSTDPTQQPRRNLYHLRE